MGHPPTGRRFRHIDEIYIFHVSGAKLARAFGVEDNASRMRQLGMCMTGMEEVWIARMDDTLHL